MSGNEPRLVSPGMDRIDQLIALSDAARWNQTHDDWRWMLDHGRARALLLHETLIASTLVLPWPPASAPADSDSVAWISMVLVLPEHRGQGHAGRLLRESLDWLREPERAHLLPVLDATPAGRPVYLRQGFVDTWSFNRWERTSAPPPSGPAATMKALDINAIQEDSDCFQRDESLRAFDAHAFGADRSSLLDALLRRAPQSAFIARRAGRLCGYVLARPGRRATQIGPLIASDRSVAQALLSAALASIEGAVFIDVPQAQSSIEPDLLASGFVIQRPFTRMIRPQTSRTMQSNHLAPGHPSFIWAVAGPELG
jgi:GNAT superfamily N-acetyltransferase